MERKDIIAEHISDEADYRSYIFVRLTMNKGSVASTAKDPEGSNLFMKCIMNFEEPIKKLAGHRVLALNRGEKEKILTVKSECTGRRDSIGCLEKQVITERKSELQNRCFSEVVEDSYKRLIAPAIEREIRSDLTEKAEDGAINVFGKESGAASDAASNRW